MLDSTELPDDEILMVHANFMDTMIFLARKVLDG